MGDERVPIYRRDLIVGYLIDPNLDMYYRFGEFEGIDSDESRQFLGEVSKLSAREVMVDWTHGIRGTWLPKGDEKPQPIIFVSYLEEHKELMIRPIIAEENKLWIIDNVPD